VIGLETRMLLKHYLAQGTSHTALARKFGLSRRTIRRWVQAGELDRDLDADPSRYRPRPPVPRKLDPFAAIVEKHLDDFPELSAVRLFEEVQAAGYTGGYSQLRDYVRSVRPRPVPEEILRFETDPGHQAQVDFAEFKFPWGKRYALLVVLGYSRLMWLKFYERQDMQTLVRGIEEAFAYFGGVPKEMLFDQMKALTHQGPAPARRSVDQERGVRPLRCSLGLHAPRLPPLRAQTKGKVERPIRYVRGNFVYARDFLGDADLDHQLAGWLEKANARIHGTTKEVPRVRFECEERHLLLPRAERPYASLVLLPTKNVEEQKRIVLPSIAVERRSLSAYAQLAGGAA
jgi:transposase